MLYIFLMSKKKEEKKKEREILHGFLKQNQDEYDEGYMRGSQTFFKTNICIEKCFPTLENTLIYFEFHSSKSYI